MKSRNRSAVPGCSALAGMAIVSVPAGIPSLAFSKRYDSGFFTWLRRFTTSPFQPWWIQALPLIRFWMSSVE
jgi:hypothetical protein